VLRRLVSYIESQPGGARIRQLLIGRKTTSSATRLRPSKLLGVLAHALTVLDQEQDNLPEATQRMAEVSAAHAALEALDRQVRGGRAGQRQMTPEVRTARENWLTIYGALKLLVESVLRLRGQTARLPEIFDDLAEIHRAPGVSEEKTKTPSKAKAPAPSTSAPATAPAAPAAPAAVAPAAPPVAASIASATPPAA
jgi:hypothetical protein